MDTFAGVSPQQKGEAMFSSGSESLIHNDVLRMLVEFALLTLAFVWGLREGRGKHRGWFTKRRPPEVTTESMTSRLDRTAL